MVGGVVLSASKAVKIPSLDSRLRNYQFFLPECQGATGVSQNAARAILLPRRPQPILGRGCDDRNGVDLCQVEN
jgi:hypothetical protein